MQAASKERVLLVDDEPQVLVALEDLLSDRFTIFKTASAEDALEVMEREPEIAVIITDQRMPRMTGDELLARIGPSSDTQRILLTGFADLSAVIRAVNDGRIFSYVTKPWSPADLQLKVQTAAGHFRLMKELARERQLLHDLMDSMPDGIYFKGPDLRFQRVNRAFVGMTGYGDQEGVVGRRLAEVFPVLAGHESTELEERQVLFEGNAVVDVVREYVRDGEKHWLSETKAPIRGADGRVVGLVGIARDVTERVAIQEALRESEERFRKQTRVLNSILDGMGDGVIAVGTNDDLLLFNRRAQQILGTPSSGAPQVHWTEAYDVRTSEDRTRISRADDPLLRAMNGDGASVSEVVVGRGTSDGPIVAVTATALVDDENKVAGGIALLRDVTRQRSLERQLAQAQKMEAVGRLAGGVAHDFNNLLSVIQCYGDILREALAVDSPLRADVGELLGAADRAAALTRQLLAFSRRRIVQSKVLSLNEVVSDVEKMLRRIIGEDIDLVTHLSPALGAVRADPSQIEQIILNLTVNARDAMPEGGKLTIETRNATFSDEYVSSHARVPPGHFATLTVTDTGIGMDAETQARIFEPFFTTKDVGKGTGLGLSTVYGIVEQSGGSVLVYSEPGRGSSFKVYLPRVDAIPAAATHGRTLAPASGTGTILLVEDDESVRRVATRILRNCGYDVLEARHAAEARRVCDEAGSTVDLLLTDVVMPGTSGIRLAEELSTKYPRLRVLYMSGYPGAAVVHEGALAAGAPYIEKPFSPVLLAEKVREVLGLDASTSLELR